MAKIPFSKLGLKINTKVKTLTFNEQEVEVLDYLPISEKLDLITTVINNTVDNNGYYNPVKLEIYLVLEIINAYTNLTFTAKQKEDPLKLYDLLCSTNFLNEVMNIIDPEEISMIKTSIYNSVKSIYDYRNSVLGILEAITTNYSELDLNAQVIQEKIANGENIEFLKDVLSKLG